MTARSPIACSIISARTIVLADKAYDADRIRELIQEQGATPNIPPKSNRKWKPCFSKRLYRERNLIERFFSTCIMLRLPTHGGYYVWEFYKDGREVKVRIDGRAAFSTLSMMQQAALAGLSLAYLPEDLVASNIREGRLVHLLADWSPPRPAYHRYYPSRRQHSPAFVIVLEALRYRTS